MLICSSNNIHLVAKTFSSLCCCFQYSSTLHHHWILIILTDSNVYIQLIYSFVYLCIISTYPEFYHGGQYSISTHILPSLLSAQLLRICCNSRYHLCYEIFRFGSNIFVQCACDKHISYGEEERKSRWELLGGKMKTEEVLKRRDIC